LLDAHGAVSAPVARAMATAVCRASRTTCGLAVTGIAGPAGGTPTKPVGTVFAAALSPRGVSEKHWRFHGGREAVERRAAHAALDMLRRALLEGPASRR